MTIEVQVHLPGKTNPIDLDEFANIICAIGANGFSPATQRLVQPATDYFSYDNPKTDTKVTVTSEKIMTRSN